MAWLALIKWAICRVKPFIERLFNFYSSPGGDLNSQRNIWTLNIQICLTSKKTTFLHTFGKNNDICISYINIWEDVVSCIWKVVRVMVTQLLTDFANTTELLCHNAINKCFLLLFYFYVTWSAPRKYTCSLKSSHIFLKHLGRNLVLSPLSFL